MKILPEVPTQEMIEEGAQRLVRVETGNEVWPDSWNKADVAAARNEAERCYLSMYAAAPDVKDDRIAALEAEVVKLQAQLAKARSDALEAVEAERKDVLRLCVEVLAMEIYASWKDQDGYVPWVVKGNSLKQGDARAIARRRIDAAIAEVLEK